MIIYVQQTKSNFDMQWCATDKNGLSVADIAAPFVVGKFEATVSLNTGESAHLYYNPYDKSWGERLQDRLSFKVLATNGKLGHILGKTRKTGFLKGYAYYEIVFGDEIYEGYEVGFGHKGLYLCVYKNDRLIAIIDKKLVTINFKDAYTVYMEDATCTLPILAFLTYYDVTVYGDLMDVAVLSAKERIVVTPQKELIAKYDPNFIPRIKAMEGI